MNRELAILQYADYAEKIEYGCSSLYLMINRQIEDYPGLFGFCQLSDDFEEWKELFARTEQRAKEMGLKTLTGPVNYTTWMSYRWAISGFERRLFPDCENPPYYIDYIRRLGYGELYTYRSADILMENPLYAAGKEIYEQKLREGVVFRRCHGEEVYQFTREVYDISVNAFAGSYLYSPISYEAFEQIYTIWTRQVELDMFIAYIDGKAVGYVMGYPYKDMYISKTSAVIKELQKHKLYLALLYAGCAYVRGLGYEKMLYHFQCEQRKTFRRFDSQIESNEKRYAVFSKEL